VETFVAARLAIDNWRWQGVPFYLRAGKRLARKNSVIVVTFKTVPHSMFQPLTPADLLPNTLLFHVQPEEGICLRFQAKRPGPRLCMDTTEMKFYYSDLLEGELPDAYERLLLDCLNADPTLFLRHDAVEISWSLLMPVLERWADGGASSAAPLHPYPAGSWGPEAAEALPAADGRSWVAI
jgi:glucose-6-phosphate 1-dehydrogenase